MKGLAKFGKGVIDFGKGVFKKGKDIYNSITSDNSEDKKSFDIDIKKEIKDIKEVFSSNKVTQQNAQNENKSLLVDTAKIGKSAYDVYKAFAENSKADKNQLEIFDDKLAMVEESLQQNGLENQAEEVSKIRKMMKN